MTAPTIWFIFLALLSLACLALGWAVGRGGQHRAYLGMSLGLVAMGVWVYLLRHPAVAVNIFTPRLMSYLEGTAVVPLFMVVVGAGYTLSKLPRQKRFMSLAVALGMLYFFHGGFWMIQKTPTTAFGNMTEGNYVLQTQDFSCVPAACATALNELGIPSTEAEMAQYTQTRAGTGATLYRACDGLNSRLWTSRYRAQIVQPSYEELAALTPPVVTPLQFESTQKHMVVVLGVEKSGIRVLDPEVGAFIMDPQSFRPAYLGQAIVFTHQ